MEIGAIKLGYENVSSAEVLQLMLGDMIRAYDAVIQENKTLRKDTLKDAAEAMCIYCRETEWEKPYNDRGAWRHIKRDAQYKDGGQYCRAGAILNLENNKE